MGYLMRKDYDFFMGNLESLYLKYGGRVLVIKDASVVGDFDDMTSAYLFACEKYGLGHFSIYECKSPDRDSYVIRYANNNVAFA